MSAEDISIPVTGLLDSSPKWDAPLEYICVEIVNDSGDHGSFLKAFARAYLRADPQNRGILRPAAVALVRKYDLTKHLPGHAE